MTFRLAQLDDIRQLVELRIACIAEDLGRIQPEPLKAMREQIPQYFSAHLNRDAFAFVAQNADEIVSVALLLVKERPASPRFVHGKVAEVLNVYTKPAFRRLGCATRLMQMLLEHARENGVDRVDLSATAEGRAVYSKLGFKEADDGYTAMRFVL